MKKRNCVAPSHPLTKSDFDLLTSLLASLKPSNSFFSLTLVVSTNDFVTACISAGVCF